MERKSFWAISANETAVELETDLEHGLSLEEASERLRKFGRNIVDSAESTSGLKIFLHQLTNPLILILTFAGIITILIGHERDAIFIFAAVVANSILGFYQEYKAEKAISELKTYLKQRTRVIRSGKDIEMDAEQLVPGDLIRLSQGDRVPADTRLSFVNDLQIDESVLTGESLPISKKIESSPQNAVLADQRSMVFAGTMVTQGVAEGMVCVTGLNTELGKIASLVSQSKKEETPLQSYIKRFSIQSSIFLGIMTLIIFVAGIIFGYSPIKMFLMAVAIAVSAVPEGLPVAMTVILAVGVQRMAKRKGIVKKLIAAETLGSTTIILTDKTGTLTQAKMELDQIIPYGAQTDTEILEKSLINANVIIENPDGPPEEWRIAGKTAETALVRSAALRGVKIFEAKNKVSILNFIPFNPINKFSTSLIKKDNRYYLTFLGAPDIFVSHSFFSRNERSKILEQIDSLATSGAFVMGVASKEILSVTEIDFSRKLDLSGLILDGLLVLRDPIRPFVKQAIKKVNEAGIKTVIMTGDHGGTALSVAKEVGLKINSEGILGATELEKLSDEELRIKLSKLCLISRVSPIDKMRIVRAFQEIGETVAMTGDGVNDAASIKQADVGIAMGSGTEVTRDVADLVLLDDNFETIVAAIEEGRRILNNIRKVLIYLLSNVLDALILIGGSIFAGIALPLNALQILWVNFFSDSFPAIAFAFEKNDSDLKRLNRVKSLFNPLMKYLIWFIGVSTSILLFGLYWFLLKLGYQQELVQTFIFASFGTYSLFLAFAIRNLDKSILRYPLFSNIYMIVGVTVGIILMALAIYLPALQKLFGTTALPPIWLLGVVSIGILNILLIEFGKWIFQHKNKIKI